jgi:hypothetical protein
VRGPSLDGREDRLERVRHLPQVADQRADVPEPDPTDRPDHDRHDVAERVLVAEEACEQQKEKNDDKREAQRRYAPGRCERTADRRGEQVPARVAQGDAGPARRARTSRRKRRS